LQDASDDSCVSLLDLPIVQISLTKTKSPT
jgi:hypothetical protein